MLSATRDTPGLPSRTAAERAMKATIFVSRKMHRIRETIALLHGERHARMALLREIVEELLFLMAIEEDLLYPALRARLDRDLRPVEAEITRLQSALREL